MSDRAWTLILTDKSFLTYYFSEMQHRMTTAYELCTSILKQWGINYVPASCGPFIWVDLGKFMLERTIGEERKLARRMLDCGVWLATGEAFISEVSGWFRITFAVHEEDLRLGIER
jgi:1-aminocyclopropane-1-carboxylate synthase